MRGINVNTLLLLAGIAVAVYFYRKASSTLTPAANVIADTLFRLTSPDAAQVLGRVKLPDGSLVTFQEIVEAGGRVDPRTMIFNWRNVGYQITGREDSTYVARRLVS